MAKKDIVYFYEQASAPVSDLENIIEELEQLIAEKVGHVDQTRAVNKAINLLHDAVDELMDTDH